MDFFLGKLSAARGHIEEGLRLYDRPQHAELAFVYGEDLGVACLFFAAIILWALGYPDQAYQKSQAALVLAQELAHAHTLAEAFYFTGYFHRLRREAAVTQELAERGVALCVEQGLRYWLALNTYLQGWALAMQGQPREGMQQIECGLAAARATGLGLALDLPLAMLAEAYAQDGRIAEGLAVLSDALANVDTTGGRWGEAELHRLKGALILRLSDQNPEARMKNAEACFHQALAIARHQQGKSWELRATTSLARLWQQQGKIAEARQMLSEIYNWFTEGFDTKDLQEAKALLAELTEGV
jgi:predicted ATPase